MGHRSPIEWTDATWNPITGCTLVSEGCRNCYAAMLAAGRLKNIESRKGLAKVNADGVAQFMGEVRFNEKWLNQPISWGKPRRIFVCAHGDLFHEGVKEEWLEKIFGVMEARPDHIFQVLTKRPERMRAYLQDWNPLPNVWLGTSVENQETADERISHLLETPAAVRFISAEPLLGPLSFTWSRPRGTPDDYSCGGNYLTGEYWEDHHDNFGIYHGTNDGPGLDWVIVGGESGRNARPIDADWARAIMDQCLSADVPFFMKQMSGIKASTMTPIPDDLLIREWPNAQR